MRSNWTIPLGAISLVCVAIAIPQIYATEVDQAKMASLHPDWFTPFGLWLTALVLIFSSTYFNSSITRAIGRNTGALRTLGLLTYPLYLLHVQVGGAVLHALSYLGVNLVASTAVAIAICIAAALIVARWLEPPLKRLLSVAVDLGLKGLTSAAGRRP